MTGSRAQRSTPPIDPVDRPRPTRRYWTLLVLISIAGFALRVAAARGGLWLDEAWSAQFARETGTLLGVFVHINHDNNHHLNTIWLQLVGETAPPLPQRGLAILSGTAAIAVAAAIAFRRGPVAAPLPRRPCSPSRRFS